MMPNSVHSFQTTCSRVRQILTSCLRLVYSYYDYVLQLHAEAGFRSAFVMINEHHVYIGGSLFLIQIYNPKFPTALFLEQNTTGQDLSSDH